MEFRKTDYLWIAVAVIIYLFFSLTFLQLPGLQYDEVNFANAALGTENAGFIEWAPRIFGRRLPLMIMSYIGALKSGLFAPVFALFGTSAATVRLPVVCIGLVTLLTGCALFRRIFDRRVAVAATLLFAADPTFIFANKLDWGPISLMLCLETSSLYFMWRWMREDKSRFLVAAGFLFGLGLYNKVIFAWYLAAFFIAMILLYRDRFRRLLHWRNLVSLIPAFLIGCLPLIAYNVSTDMKTFQQRTLFSGPASDLFGYRYHLIRGTLEGSAVYGFVNQEEVASVPAVPQREFTGIRDFLIGKLAAFPLVGTAPTFFFLSASLVLIATLWVFRRLRYRAEILFLVMQILGITLFLFVARDAGGPHHVAAIYPFVSIVISYAAFELGALPGKTKLIPGILAAACLLPMMTANLVLDARHLNTFRLKGGAGSWSDAIYDLASFAGENPDKNYIFMEWGLSNQLILLSHGRISYEEFICDDPKNLARCLEPMLTRINSFLVFRVPPLGNDELLRAYKMGLGRQHREAHLAKVFYQRDGQPVYLVYAEDSTVLGNNDGLGYTYMREAENYDAKSGGDLDLKAGASNGKALGNFWGLQPEDFVSYNFTIPRAVPNARLYLRYAYENPGPQRYYLFLDGRFADVITLPSSHGYGYTAEQWNVFDSPLGSISSGTHELKIKAAARGQIINLDYWVIRDSEAAGSESTLKREKR
jgi:4-amino-4-deoxy-L-arabinose transferase-like glycosyltransferase